MCQTAYQANLAPEWRLFKVIRWHERLIWETLFNRVWLKPREIQAQDFLPPHDRFTQYNSTFWESEPRRRGRREKAFKLHTEFNLSAENHNGNVVRLVSWRRISYKSAEKRLICAGCQVVWEHGPSIPQMFHIRSSAWWGTANRRTDELHRGTFHVTRGRGIKGILSLCMANICETPTAYFPK